MRANIHPKYFEQAQVVCACGNRFTIGSTMETIHVELCNKCHPFYTGEQRFVDTASRIQKFQKKQEAGKGYVSKKEKQAKEQAKRTTGPRTLKEMLMGLQ